MHPNNFIHKNGGGLIVGPEALVGSDCYVSKDSRIEGETALSLQSEIHGKSGVLDSHVFLSVIQNSAIAKSHIAGALINSSGLEGVTIRGAGNVKAVVQDCVLTNEVVVEGCTVRNVVLSGPYLLHVDWDHTPKHRLLLTENGIKQGLLQCTGDRYHLGCVCRPFKEWDKREPLLRRWFVEKCGWPPAAFDSIRVTFEQWRAQG